MKNFVLINTDNYHDDLKYSLNEIFIKYICLIHEYIDIFKENIYIQKNHYLKYIFIKGINNINYIFSYLLLYTQNLELTVHHTQKAILYYIEFIGQIGDENHGFLKLTSKDAILFVYKKTIYQINDDFRMKFNQKKQSKELFNNVSLLIDIYNKSLNASIEQKGSLFTCEYIKDFYNEIITKNYKLVENLVQFEHICKNNYLTINHKLKNINHVIDIINIINLEHINNKFILLVQHILKKSLKKDINIDNLKKRMNDETFKQLLDQSLLKSVNYLIN